MKDIKHLFILTLIFPVFLNSQNECLISFTKSDIERIPVTDVEIVDSKLIFSTFYGGLYIIDNDSLSTIDSFHTPFPDIHFASICQYKDGMALVKQLGSGSTVYEFSLEDHSFNQIIDKSEIKANHQTNDYGHVFSYDIIAIGDMLLIGTSAGLIIYNQYGVSQIMDFNSDGLIDFVNDIEYESDSLVWFGTNVGIYKIKTEDLREVKSDASPELTDREMLSEIPCNTLLAYFDDIIYFTNDDNNFYQLLFGDINLIKEGNDELHFKSVKDIEIGFGNKIWFVNRDGIYHYNLQYFKKWKDLERGRSLTLTEDALVAGGVNELLYSCHLTIPAMREFCPEGAVWTYGSKSCDMMGNCKNAYEEIEYVRDTVIDSKPCKILSRNHFGENGDKVFEEAIIHRDSSKLYQFFNDNFNLLFDFSMKTGDTIHLNLWNFYFSDLRFLLQVDSIVYKNYGSEILRDFVCSIYCFEDQDDINPDEYYHWSSLRFNEVFGSVNDYQYLFFNQKPCIFDYNYDHFIRCYEDDVFGFHQFTDIACDSILSATSDFPKESVDIQIFPNPASSDLHIKAPSDADWDSWSIFSITGQLLLSGEVKGSSEFSISGLDRIKAGLYVILLQRMDGKMGVGKFVLQ